MNDPKTLLASLNACREAQRSLTDESPYRQWQKCERGDWLLWLAARLDIDRKVVVFAACQVARTALIHTEDPRALQCIEVTEGWTRGEKTLEEVRAARTDAAYAADAAAYAADADAADAAYAAAYAADAADAADAAADAARKESLKASAKIVRRHIPWKLYRAALDRQEHR